MAAGGSFLSPIEKASPSPAEGVVTNFVVNYLVKVVDQTTPPLDDISFTWCASTPSSAGGSNHRPRADWSRAGWFRADLHGPTPQLAAGAQLRRREKNAQIPLNHKMPIRPRSAFLEIRARALWMARTTCAPGRPAKEAFEFASDRSTDTEIRQQPLTAAQPDRGKARQSTRHGSAASASWNREQTRAGRQLARDSSAQHPVPARSNGRLPGSRRL
jgi:hypothetical protein